MVSRSQTSAAGALALLSEPEPVLKQHALNALNTLVPQFWTEISEHIALIESLYENVELPKEARDSAALVVSKVYYYLGEYDEALSFALGAGSAFEADSRRAGQEEYVETVVSRAIDRYIQTRSEETKGDPRLDSIIEIIFKRCIEDGDHKQAIGIAIESKRFDIIEQIYGLTHDTTLLSYAMEAVLDTGLSLSYRDEVLHKLFPLFPPPTPQSTHISSLTRLLVTLSDTSLTIPLLTQLISAERLLAYQFAFDLVEGGSQDFLEKVRNELPDGEGDAKAVSDKVQQILGGLESVKLYLQFLRRNNKTDMVILKNTKDALDARSSIFHNAVTFQNAFMHSGTTSDVFLRENLEWLARASNWSKFSATAALGVIHKGHFEQGINILGPYLPSDNPGTTSIAGSAYSEGGALYALGLIHAGVGSGRDGVEGYLRDKLKAASAEPVQHGAALGLGVAGMGGMNADAYEDLKQMLFTDDSAVAGEAAGYAMGLIMLGTADTKCADEMLAYARETQHEKIIRGLAVGLAFLFYGRQEEADAMIRELLADTDPILRYGGVYTLALAYAGTSNNGAIRKLLHIAVSDTSDDVRRAGVTSLAFLLFKNPAQVPRIVQLLSESYNPHVRCGATLALGIACAGTGLQEAVDILEPMTKDTVDFVRQGAFIALGMVLVQQSEAASPALSATRSLYAKIVADKHEDPMARFGAAIGQGLIDAGGRNVTISLQSQAGSKNTSAIVGMVLFCQFWYWYPLAHCASLAFEPTAIIGLDASLKLPKFEFISNARPSLFAYPQSSKPPTKETTAKVATAVLSTTAKAKAREKKKAAENGDAMETDEKEELPKENGDAEMKDLEEGSGEASGGDEPTAAGGSPDAVDGPSTGGKISSSKRKPEPSFERLSNFSRVTPPQLAHLVFPPEGRYQPVRPVSTRSVDAKRTSAKHSNASPHKMSTGSPSSERYAGGGGILILIDRRPQEEAEFIEDTLPRPQTSTAAGIPTRQLPTEDLHMDIQDGPETSPPESFEYPFSS